MKKEDERFYRIVIVILFIVVLVNAAIDVAHFFKEKKIDCYPKADEGYHNFFFLNMPPCDIESEEGYCWMGINDTINFPYWGSMSNGARNLKIVKIGRASCRERV